MSKDKTSKDAQAISAKPMLNAVLQLEIMQYNYWEHYKFEKDIAMVLPIDHPKRIMMRKATQDLLSEIHKLQNLR